MIAVYLEMKDDDRLRRALASSLILKTVDDPSEALAAVVDLADPQAVTRLIEQNPKLLIVAVSRSHELGLLSTHHKIAALLEPASTDEVEEFVAAIVLDVVDDSFFKGGH